MELSLYKLQQTLGFIYEWPHDFIFTCIRYFLAFFYWTGSNDWSVLQVPCVCIACQFLVKIFLIPVFCRIRLSDLFKFRFCYLVCKICCFNGDVLMNLFCEFSEGRFDQIFSEHLQCSSSQLFPPFCMWLSKFILHSETAVDDTISCQCVLSYCSGAFNHVRQSSSVCPGVTELRLWGQIIHVGHKAENSEKFSEKSKLGHLKSDSWHWAKCTYISKTLDYNLTSQNNYSIEYMVRLFCQTLYIHIYEQPTAAPNRQF